MIRHGGRRGQIADFRGSFETINWLYLLFKCGIKAKTHFEWLLWHWSSLRQLNLEPTRPNGLVGCKVPTDLVKISVKKATHMGFYQNTLQWRHNPRDGVSHHQPHDCLLNCLFRRRSKKTSKLRVTGLCVGNSPVTGEFPAQMASNAENISIWWRHHDALCDKPTTSHIDANMVLWPWLHI